MPQLPANGLRALSLYSGGGGLDLSFERAGYEHVASYEILGHAAETLARNRPNWKVFGSEAGDVKGVDWTSWKGKVDVLHGGPPCQPFSNAGRQEGHLDPRDCWPATAAAIKAVQPNAFIAENVPALAGTKFSSYVQEIILTPLTAGRPRYHVRQFILEARDFGIPQVRRRVFFVGFKTKRAAEAFEVPEPTHAWNEPTSNLLPTMSLREALGLPKDNRYVEGLSPTIRSGLTGPRHTTSVNNSASSARTWASMGVWPNGVAVDRTAASGFPPDSGAFRMSVADVALIQGFPESWTWPRAVYQAVGQIGNAVPPPLGWRVARAVAAALKA
ncbi:DNA cytosine methyltransferase [Kineosporia mesophila]